MQEALLLLLLLYGVLMITSNNCFFVATDTQIAQINVYPRPQLFYSSAKSAHLWQYGGGVITCFFPGPQLFIHVYALDKIAYTSSGEVLPVANSVNALCASVEIFRSM